MYCAICSCSAIEIGDVTSCARLLLRNLASCKAMGMHWRLLNKRAGHTYLLDLFTKIFHPLEIQSKLWAVKVGLQSCFWMHKLLPWGTMLCRQISMPKLLSKILSLFLCFSPIWTQRASKMCHHGTGLSAVKSQPSILLESSPGSPVSPANVILIAYPSLCLHVFERHAKAILAWCIAL